MYLTSLSLAENDDDYKMRQWMLKSIVMVSIYTDKLLLVPFLWGTLGSLSSEIVA